MAVCANDILGCQPFGNVYGVVLDSRVQTLTQTLSDCVVNVGLLSGTYGDQCHLHREHDGRAERKRDLYSSLAPLVSGGNLTVVSADSRMGSTLFFPLSPGISQLPCDHAVLRRRPSTVYCWTLRSR